ncbi:MAG TPA: lysozyme [Rhizobiales bacterium]|nr:lysozyme [Hyphomicrobiales bacterium]
MRINKPTLDLVIRFEGLRLAAYRDAVGVWTIGYGHTSMAGPPEVKPGMHISGKQAQAILRDDVNRVAKQVSATLGPGLMARLNENQFGALVSFAYNVGIGNLDRSSVLRAVRKGRFDDVPRLLLRWTKAGGKKLRGLVRRRRAEGKLWLTPPGRRHPPPPVIIRQKVRELKNHPKPAVTWAAFLLAMAGLAAALWHKIMEVFTWDF